MGSPKAQAYLASPAVVAASAVAGYICGPYHMDACEPIGSVTIAAPPPRGPTSVELVPGFPAVLSGEVRARGLIGRQPRTALPALTRCPSRPDVRPPLSCSSATRTI